MEVIAEVTIVVIGIEGVITFKKIRIGTKINDLKRIPA